MNYLVVFLHMLYMSVQVEFCVHEVLWRVNNNRKPMKFRDILYYLNAIFLQRVFEALNNVFKYSKTMRTECTKVHYLLET
jgi:hypothetical protein